jgi:hypothetical protein
MPACLRQFLTPAAWRQARRGLPAPRRDARWGLHNLILVLLAMTWSLGESAPERFEMARGIAAICRPKRRGPGRTARGFQKALARLPMRPLATLAAAVRRRLPAALDGRWSDGDFVVLGCDGSRVECPRTDELAARMGRAGKADAPPAIWVTALVHLATGVPWAWQLGKGDASERGHLRRRLGSLPASALIVADAGFDGYDLVGAILGAGGSFLIRMASRVHLITDGPSDAARFGQGTVSYWPKEAQKAGRPPLRLRLIRLRGRARGGGKRPADVWLLTNVPAAKLTATRAARFYRLRWENEGLFRTYKRTLAKVRLVGRTVRAVHREAYGSLLACQLLLAQGAWALGRVGVAGVEAGVCSARQAVRVVRAELLAAMRPERRTSYLDRLSACRRERRERTSAKQRRDWPSRKPHEPPKPPRLRTMDDREKALISTLSATPKSG